MGLYLSYNLPKEPKTIYPDYLEFQTTRGTHYQVHWEEIFISRTKEKVVAHCRSISLREVENRCRSIEENSEIIRLLKDFRRFSDMTWQTFDAEEDSWYGSELEIEYAEVCLNGKSIILLNKR